VIFFKTWEMAMKRKMNDARKREGEELKGTV
jgi:hypothetical protein